MVFPKLWFKSEEMMALNFREFFNVYRNIYIYMIWFILENLNAYVIFD